MWLKLSDDFGVDCARVGLSDAAFRTHTEALLWIMSRENGPMIDSRDLRRFAETAEPARAVAELVEAGYWEPVGDRWHVLHQMKHQPEPDLIAKRREDTAERKRRQRRKQARLDDVPTGPAVPSRVTSVVTERETRVGAGRDGKTIKPALSKSDSAIEEWPDVLDVNRGAVL